MSDLPFGIDISRYQYSADGKLKPIIDISFYQNPDAIDYDLIAANVSGVILRACYGIWRDTAFDRHYQELAQIRGVPVGAYHYIIGSVGIQEQADAFNLAVGLKDMRLGCWIDVEDRRAGTRIYRQQVLDYAALQPDMGVYTSKSAWAEIMGGAYLSDRKLWVAHYTANPYPLLPQGWDSWWLWQHTSTGRLPGYTGNLDCNRFNGTHAELLAYFGLGEETPEPEPPAEVEDKLFDAKVTTTPPNRLKTRYTPAGKERPETDWLQSQAVVPVYETHSTGWWRVAPEAWSSATWMERVEDKLPEPQEPLFQARVYSWATPYVNVRAEPSLSSGKTGFKYPLAVTDVMSTVPDWYEVPEGWMMSRFLERLDDEPPSVAEFAYYGPVYNQRDIRWALHPLGTRSTIGQNGCLMTAVSMVCNKFGHMENPLELNDWLTSHGGYLDGNLFLWDKLTELYPDMKFDGFVYNPNRTQIIAAVMDGVLPIMYVDFNDDTPLIEMHWVLGIGVMDGDVIIADPWTGTIGKLSEMYPKSVIRYGSYRKIN